MKLQEQNNGQKLLTIPRDLAKAMGLKKGDELEFYVKDSKTLEIRIKD
jgi:bifunctional DNA-binding transcriptional regulator/antitoxin component of YhaV-PrlF toxin-antitoxin module